MMKLIFRVMMLFAVFMPFQSKVYLTNSNKPLYTGKPQIIANTLPPQETGPCNVAITNMDMNGVELDIYSPVADSCSDSSTAPFPSIVFAHGFSMFGFSDGQAANQGNGEHLASWGYIVAIPNLPDDFEDRAKLVIDALDFLGSANQDPLSSLYQKIDANRLGAAGYSLGGATALAVSARDSRIKVVVALDPVYHEGGMSGEGDPVWDPVAEAPDILIPTGILGAPADSCNAQADYQDIYQLIGAKLKAAYHIVGASHCIFTDPGNDFCSITCGGTIESYMTSLSQKYMTAWFNFYLGDKSAYYSYLYGSDADQDIDAGLIMRQVDTFPGDIEPPVNLSADFEASPLIGFAPMTVIFKNISTGTYSSSYWEFGDGHTSSVEHPTHIYSSTGSYTVTLTINGDDGTDDEKKVGYINIYTHLLFLPSINR